MSVPQKLYPVLICLALAVGILLIYGQVRHFEFINYDDGSYVYLNSHVLNGLTHSGIHWAFTASHSSNWHPLTWLSLMADMSIFGVNPGAMHFVNVILHILNTTLLFLVLVQMTGSLWPSAFVAAAFAFHPMHVESVAWVAERKDVLSTLFWLLTMAAYVSYVRRPGTSKYLFALFLFALGLLAKPMLVTLPLILLIMDYWPLNRLNFPSPKKPSRAKNQVPQPGLYKTLQPFLVEKIPFFSLSAASCVVTFIAQKQGGAVAELSRIPLDARIANTFLSYARYIGRLFWPQDLAVFYLFDANRVPFSNIVFSAIFLLILCVVIYYLNRGRKYILAGWCWFLVTLIPVIGIIQVGMQAFADRYTYISYIGLFIIIAWGIQELCSKLKINKPALAFTAIAILVVLGIAARQQTSYWKNSITLFTHALEATDDLNYVAHCNLSSACSDRGDLLRAAEHAAKAIKISPDYTDAVLAFGNVFLRQGDIPHAIEYFQKVVTNRPGYPNGHVDLGSAFLQQGRLAEALAEFKIALKLHPDCKEALNNLALVMATVPGFKSSDPTEPITLASRACVLSYYKNPFILGTLAAAYASAGQFADAVKTANKALAFADPKSDRDLVIALQDQLACYSAGKPYTDPSVIVPDQNAP
jgi:tetratricopeptide (TPR) repeat protein